MDFKQYRLSRNMTQAQAGALIGMSATYWGWLESGSDKADYFHHQAFARVLKYIDHPEIDTPISRERMNVKSRFGISSTKASELIGAGNSTWSNLATGCLKPTVRWVRMVNALLIELSEPAQPEQDLQPSGEIETILPTVLTPDPESDVQEPEISNQSLIPFAYGSHPVRCKMTGNEPWFVLRDICKAIEYSAGAHHAARLIDEDEVQKYVTSDSAGRMQEFIYVSEPGLYQFLGSTNVPTAKPFRKWMFREIMPQIRKTGQYSLEPVQPTQVDPLDAIILSLTEIKAVKVKQAQMEATIEAQAQQIKQIEQRTPTDPRHSAKLTLLELQALNSKKAQLHKLKAAIVRQAERNTDDFSLPFRKHGNVWRYIHSQAVPAVASLNDYTTQAQLNTAINGAEILLTRLGGVLPQQLSIDIESEAV